MRYGVVFPQTEFGNDPQALKDYAQTAEGLGYDYLLVYDHVLGAHPGREPKLTGPYTYQHPFHEPAVDTMHAGFTSPQAHIAAVRSFREILD
jgi:alkanesulfonate monooxygenase SsuD/methylene tetrahydromethanopterin reductase-like flavin-dependent oxidoreductase (luciferase family)